MWEGKKTIGILFIGNTLTIKGLSGRDITMKPGKATQEKLVASIKPKFLKKVCRRIMSG